MAVNDVNAVFVGWVKDEYNFPCQLLEDPLTGARMLAYSPEHWWARNNYIRFLEANGKLPPDNTPRNAWPAKPPKEG